MLRLLPIVLAVALSLAGCSKSEAPAPSVTLPALTVAVKGMMCVEGCGQAVTELVMPLKGMKKVHVDIPGERIHCEFDAALTDPATLGAAIEAALKDSAYTFGTAKPYRDS